MSCTTISNYGTRSKTRALAEAEAAAAAIKSESPETTASTSSDTAPSPPANSQRIRLVSKNKKTTDTATKATKPIAAAKVTKSAIKTPAKRPARSRVPLHKKSAKSLLLDEMEACEAAERLLLSRNGQDEQYDSEATITAPPSPAQSPVPHHPRVSVICSSGQIAYVPEEQADAALALLMLARKPVVFSNQI